MTAAEPRDVAGAVGGNLAAVNFALTQHWQSWSGCRCGHKFQGSPDEAPAELRAHVAAAVLAALANEQDGGGDVGAALAEVERLVEAEGFSDRTEARVLRIVRTVRAAGSDDGGSDG